MSAKCSGVEMVILKLLFQSLPYLNTREHQFCIANEPLPMLNTLGLSRRWDRESNPEPPGSEVTRCYKYRLKIRDVVIKPVCKWLPYVANMLKCTVSSFLSKYIPYPHRNGNISGEIDGERYIMLLDSYVWHNNHFPLSFPLLELWTRNWYRSTCIGHL